MHQLDARRWGGTFLRCVLLHALVFSVIATSSCRQIGACMAEGMAEGIAQSLAESLGEALPHLVLEHFVPPALTVEIFYLEQDRWPGSREELVAFCRHNDWDSPAGFWESCCDPEFTETEDGSLEIAFTRTTQLREGGSMIFSGRTVLPVPSDDEEDLREGLERLLRREEENPEGEIQATSAAPCS